MDGVLHMFHYRGEQDVPIIKDQSRHRSFTRTKISSTPTLCDCTLYRKKTRKWKKKKKTENRFSYARGRHKRPAGDASGDVGAPRHGGHPSPDVSEVDVPELHPSARARRAARQLHRHLRRRHPPDVPELHVADPHHRRPPLLCMSMNSSGEPSHRQKLKIYSLHFRLFWL